MSAQTKKFDLNTVWFVTGCSSGLGRSIAQIVHRSGHRIVATARDVSSLSYLPDEPNVFKLSLDVTSREAIKDAVAATVERFGRLDVAINNAGYAHMGDTEVLREEDARVQMETLFWGPVHLTQEVLPIFREVNPPGQGGTVVNVSSMGGWLAFPGHSFYHAGKFALEGFTESVAKEVLPEWNIKFLIVAPGGIRTNFTGPSLKFTSRHPAYDTPAGPLTQLMQYMTAPGTSDSFSDPDICAKLLFDIVVGQNERPMPSRLLMGAETIPLMQADIERTLKEIDEWKEETLKCSPKGGADLSKLKIEL